MDDTLELGDAEPTPDGPWDDITETIGDAKPLDEVNPFHYIVVTRMKNGQWITNGCKLSKRQAIEQTRLTEWDEAQIVIVRLPA